MKETRRSPQGALSAAGRAVEDRRAQVLARAVLKAAVPLGLSQADLAEILGVSEASVSRMKEGTYRLGAKEFELGALLVRVFRGLDALMGGHEGNLRAWFHSENEHLQGTPALLVRRIEGLTRVAQYLDFMRGAQ